MKTVLFVLSVLLLLCALTCKKNPVGSPENTQDTTSHNFAFTQYSLGGGEGSSYFQDVAIVNDTLAYAVGTIFAIDSTGQPDPQPYGVAVWNGTQWSLKRIFAIGPTGPASSFGPHGLIAFSGNDLWLAAGGVFHWDGQSNDVTAYWINDFQGNPSPVLSSGQTAERLWGTSGQDLYAIGRNGALAHYDGSKWQKIESGTELDINDIWGDYNSATGQNEILCVAADVLENPGIRILKIVNGSVLNISTKNITAGNLSGVWFKSGSQYYVVGSGIYQTANLSDSTWKNGQFDISSYYIYGIRGNGINDIVATGGVGELLHFNGNTWKSYFSETKLSDGNYNAIAIKNNILVAVGQNGSNAVILMGKR